jgi:hypothetical protein
MNEKVKKLKAILTDEASSENEKAIAEKILNSYAEQGIDIDDEEITPQKYDLTDPWDKKFFDQLVSNVFGDRSKEMQGRRADGLLWINLSQSDAIELRTKFDFYREDYKKQEEILYVAWIQKNQLYSRVTLPEDFVYPEQTEEQARMERAIKEAEYHKQLTS